MKLASNAGEIVVVAAFITPQLVQTAPAHQLSSQYKLKDYQKWKLKNYQK
jgi:hypothetical protein